MKARQRAPDNFGAHASLAINYILLNRKEEEGASAAKALELKPNFSVSHLSKTLKYKNQDFNKSLADALRKAGFPD